MSETVSLEPHHQYCIGCERYNAAKKSYETKPRDNLPVDEAFAICGQVGCERQAEIAELEFALAGEGADTV